MFYVWHKMIFAWEQLWEQLSLLLFKPLLKCLQADCVCQWKGLNQAVLVPGGTEAGWGMNVKVWHSHHKIYTPLKLANSLWDMKNMKMRTIGTSRIIQLFKVERLDDSTPNIKLIGLRLFFKLYLLLFQIKCDPSLSILLKL